ARVRRPRPSARAHVAAPAGRERQVRKPASALVLALVAALVPARALHAQPSPAKLVPAQSEIAFQVKQSGVPIDGKFRRFDAQLALDPKAPKGGSVTVSIDTASATVGFADSDAELPRAPWFDTTRFPRAV